ncbi:MAG: hypothetical protein AAFQ65_07645 [Myxococcota bacterium]
MLNENERLELWLELNVLATQILEFADWWWRLDPGLRRANDRRAGVREDEDFIPE